MREDPAKKEQSGLPFYHRYDVCDSSATGVGAEKMNSVVCMLYRPHESVRLRSPNLPLDSTRPFWRAIEYDLGHSAIPRWHASMRAARRKGVLGLVRCGTGPSSWVRARAPPVQHIFAAVINVASTRFKADKDIMDALVHLRKKRGAGVRGGQPTAG